MNKIYCWYTFRPIIIFWKKKKKKTTIFRGFECYIGTESIVWLGILKNSEMGIVRA